MTKPLGIIAYTALETLPCLFLLINLLCEDGFQTAGFWWLSSIRLCSACGGANLCFGHQLCRPEQSVAAPCVRLSARSFLGGVCLCLGALPAHRSRRAVFLAATALALVMRTKGVLWWTALAEKNSWMPAAGLFVAWFALVPIWWHGTRLVLSLCKSINLFFSVLELQTNWVLVKGARLNSGFAWVPVQILSPMLPSVIVG